MIQNLDLSLFQTRVAQQVRITRVKRKRDERAKGTRHPTKDGDHEVYGVSETDAPCKDIPTHLDLSMPNCSPTICSTDLERELKQLKQIK